MKTNIKMIRKHVPSDLEEIMNVWQQSTKIAHPFLTNEFTEKVKSDMRLVYIPNSETWVYQHSKKIIAFISMIGNEIGGLFVLPFYQSHGIGTKLVNFTLDIHQKLEVEVFEMNKIGRSFYKKYGFLFESNYFHTDSGQQVLRLKFE